MDLIEDEPRRHPKPVPFSQNALLQPTVPEVSLLLQENLVNQSGKKNDSFTGTDFQTYNSWRWKHMNLMNSSTQISEPKKVNKHSTAQDCFLIKDKYFTSDTEKRKNEILYGELEEPRRPLPPRTNPVIPTCVESFFSTLSFEDLKSDCSSQETRCIPVKPACLEKNMVSNYTNQMNFKHESGNSEKLYGIISEQNKQMQVLQHQIEQLLKLQEVKDKQIEQLLKCQESKEKKIEQFLQTLEIKNKEMVQLTNSKDKLEKHVQELLKAKENMQKENTNLMRTLSEISQKDVHSVGTMAYIELADANTCTTLDDVLMEFSNKKNECTIEEDMSCIRDGSKLEERDKSLSLHSSDLPVIQENAPTPQSSIHVDIQDFPDSSDDSASETDIPTSRFSAVKEAQSSPLGYTFYNNVLTQLKDIIQNSGQKENNTNRKNKSENLEMVNKPQTECNFGMDNRGPVHSFQAWDMFGKENVPGLRNVQEMNERFSEEMQNICLGEKNSPSDISLKINALAVKYLKEEQIKEFGLQTQMPGHCQRDVTIYNVTNLSFGSMRYLDRYQMLPKGKENQRLVVNIPKNEHSPAELLHRKKRLTIEENVTSVGNVLDITTLNQQPKLL